MGTLYLVGTPIGNLEDITLRALRILSQVDLIAAEDTRLTGRMLKHYEIESPLISFHGDSSIGRVNQILDALSQGDVAVVSDAGMPGISDPGSDLVRGALELGCPVIPIPGPSAVTAAAAASGVVDEGYVFAGFLPRSSNARKRRLAELSGVGLPIIAFESPHRVRQLLDDLVDRFPRASVTFGREITKLHEEWVRGNPQELRDHVQERGEFTLVIEINAVEEPDEGELDDVLAEALAEGRSVRDAVDLGIAATGLSRSRVYQRALELQKSLGR